MFCALIHIMVVCAVLYKNGMCEQLSKSCLHIQVRYNVLIVAAKTFGKIGKKLSGFRTILALLIPSVSIWMCQVLLLEITFTVLSLLKSVLFFLCPHRVAYLFIHALCPCSDLCFSPFGYDCWFNAADFSCPVPSTWLMLVKYLNLTTRGCQCTNHGTISESESESKTWVWSYCKCCGFILRDQASLLCSPTYWDADAWTDLWIENKVKV